MYLEQIQNVNDIKNIDSKNYEELAQEIREFLIRKISVTGGHLGSNLGAVELTMALHLALKLPDDKIIWDVGHQSYTHSARRLARKAARCMPKTIHIVEQSTDRANDKSIRENRLISTKSAGISAKSPIRCCARG